MWLGMKKYVPFKKDALCNILRLKFEPELKNYMSQENGAENFASLISQELEALATELSNVFND